MWYCGECSNPTAARFCITAARMNKDRSIRPAGSSADFSPRPLADACPHPQIPPTRRNFRSARSRDAGDRVPEDGDHSASVAVNVDEPLALNSVLAFPADGEPRIALLAVA